MIIEAAFPDEECILAILSKHLCPSMLEDELKQLKRSPEIFVTHAKPDQLKNIGNSIAKFAGSHKPKMLSNRHIFEF